MSLGIVLPFFGARLACWDPLDGNSGEAAGGLLGSYSLAHLFAAGLGGGLLSPTWPSEADFSFALIHRIGNIGSNAQFLTGRSLVTFLEASVSVMEMRVGGAGSDTAAELRFYTLQSGVMTFVQGVVVAMGLFAPPNRIHITLTPGADGSITVTINNTERFSVSGLAHTDFAGVDQVKLGGSNYSFAYNEYDETYADDRPVVMKRVKSYGLDTLSATNTGWSGVVGDVTEIPMDTGTFNYAAAADLVSTYYDNGLVLDFTTISAVGVGVKANCDMGDGPQNLQIALRSSGANNFSPTLGGGLTDSLQAGFHGWRENPVGPTPWTPATAALAEGGQKSIA